MQWEVVIGLETHAQLSTVSKIFSGAPTAFGAEPNTQACGVDIALPGVLPVLNTGAVERAIRFGLAVGAKINSPSIFARKNYFYPDLPKGYQISQYELPIVTGGEIPIHSPTRGEIKIRLTRAHLEEDAGKSLHEDFSGRTGIDLNRAGTPLLEIVSEPEMCSAAEAVAYAKALHELVTWHEICDGNMQEGSFRCDANVSVRPEGSNILGTRREIKNLNSFRFLQQAIEYEVQWQIGELEDGRSIQQATVLFDPDTGETRMMRTKEDAHDYRYFPDPDLLPLFVSDDWIKKVFSETSESPGNRKSRYQQNYALSASDADYLTSDRYISDYFEGTLKLLSDLDQSKAAKQILNLMKGRLASSLADKGLSYSKSPLKPLALAGLVRLAVENVIPSSTANVAVTTMFTGSDKSVGEVFSQLKFRQFSDERIPRDFAERLSSDHNMSVGSWNYASFGTVTQADMWPSREVADNLDNIVDQVLAANAQQVADFRAGKEKAFNSLVGQVMKASRGKANPQQVNDILRRKLAP